MVSQPDAAGNQPDSDALGPCRSRPPMPRLAVTQRHDSPSAPASALSYRSELSGDGCRQASSGPALGEVMTPTAVVRRAAVTSPEGAAGLTSRPVRTGPPTEPDRRPVRARLRGGAGPKRG